MNKKNKALALVLSLILLLSASGCGAGNDKYRAVGTLAEQKFCVGFRLDDKSGQAVIAALKVLEANGTVSDLSMEWFGEDVSLLKGDEQALEALTEKPKKRTFIIGYDAGRLPFSGTDASGKATGFDVSLAQAVCDELNWTAKFLPIDVSQAVVELNSGNVDCVWGGFVYDEGNQKINQSPVYMENTIVLCALKSSSIRRIGSLKGKTLMLSENAYYNAVLENNAALSTKPGFFVRVPNGTQACFEALNSDKCDAIITDLAALDYYR